MKHLLYAFALGFLAITATACGGGDSGTGDSPTSGDDDNGYIIEGDTAGATEGGEGQPPANSAGEGAEGEPAPATDAGSPAEGPEGEVPPEGTEGEPPTEGPEGEVPAEGPEGEPPTEGTEGEPPTEGPEGELPTEGTEGEAPAEGAEGGAPIEFTVTPDGCHDYAQAHDCQAPPPAPARLIILGDSISAGCCIFNEDQYADILKAKLEAHYGTSIELVRAAVNGWKTKDVLKQLQNGDSKFDKGKIYGAEIPTITAFTIGGNDLTTQLDNEEAEAMDFANTVLLPNLREILTILTDPKNFPAGNTVTYANVYDPSDGTLDLRICGFAPMGDQSKLKKAFDYSNAEMLQQAIEFKVQLIKMYEAFLGHGWHDNPGNSPEERHNRWFDATCIHPTVAGHATIAELFYQSIVNGPAE